MKFRYQALAWAGLSGLASFAGAQSSINLAGVVDISMRYSSNSAGSVQSLASGGNSTSRLIFSGTEDLGGGLSAGFWLEATMQADTGSTSAGNQLFDRRSTVSLANRYGEVRLGRDWTPVFWGAVSADPFVATGIGSTATFLNPGVNTVFRRAFGANPSTLSRASNAIEYWLPANLGGVYGQVMSAFGEKSGTQSANGQGSYNYDAFRLGYRAQGFDVAAFGGRTRIDATQAGVGQQGISGAYTFGNGACVSAAAVNSSYLSSKQTHSLLAFTLPIRQTVIKVAYNHLNQKGTDAAGRSIDPDDASSLSLGAEYFLSKRTLIYATVAHVNNKGAATFTVPGGPTAGVTPGTSSRGYELGLRTSF